MNEYMNNLFRIYRKRYGGLRELIKADEEHHFWAVIDGQPVCNRKTVNNLESGRHETDEDTVAFLIGKLGYRYISSSQPADELSALACGVRMALLAGDSQEMERLGRIADALDYRGIFLFDLWSALIRCACRFYLENSLSEFAVLRSMPAETGIYTPEMALLYLYLRSFWEVFMEGDFNSGNIALRKLEMINEFDLAVLVIAQCGSESLFLLMRRQFTQRLAGLDERQKRHLHFWLTAATETCQVCHQKELSGFDEQLLNDRIRKIKTAANYASKRLLREIRDCQNPQISALYRRKVLEHVRHNHRYKILYDVIEQLEL